MGTISRLLICCPLGMELQTQLDNCNSQFKVALDIEPISKSNNGHYINIGVIQLIMENETMEENNKTTTRIITLA